MKKYNHGFTLVELLIAAAIVIISSLAISEFITHFKKQTRQEKIMTLQKDYINTIDDILSVNSTCSRFISRVGAISITGGISSSATGLSVEIDTDTFINAYPELKNPTFSIKKVQLSYTKDSADVDVSNWSNSSTYSGTLIFSLDIIDPRYVAYQNLTYDIKLPIFLFDERNSDNWQDIQCAAGQAPDSFLVSQICNMYGGMLTDSMHCDMLRVIRDQNYGLNAAPTWLLSQDAATKTRRLAMSDAICYLDTLIVMAPKVPFPALTPRTNTRFCKYPGTSTALSKDVQEIFNEVR